MRDRRYKIAACSGTSDATLNAIFAVRPAFDQGCTCPFPLPFLDALTPPCYSHDFCIECASVRASCDKPFFESMKRECKRKIGGFIKRALCIIQAADPGVL